MMPNGGRRGGGVVRGSRVQVNHTYMEKSTFPALPQEMEVALSYYYHDERTGGQTTQANRRFPLCEFDTQLPRYAPELYQIYRHARIMAIDLKMEVVNTSSTEPLIAAVGVLPLANVASITTPLTIISVPGAVYKQIGLSTGMSRVTINKRFVTEKWLGELTIGSNTYLQTYSEALSSAIWTELPSIYAGVIGAKTGATWTGIIDYRLVYHLRFSEYNIPSLGLIRNPKPVYMDENDDEADDVEWVQPPPIRAKKLASVSNASMLSRK